ncbi:hypothetical protein BS78_02G008900 [Paspalum vaginatum]|nr:hypothetical protein BS78_02G008900 [Paspalum vaginatum]
MEVLVSAIMGELAARSVSFLMDRCVNWAADDGGVDDGEKRSRRLQRLLLRVHVIVEEAEQRRITSQAMLRHLNLLRQEMFRGYHALDDHESSSSRRVVAGGEASCLRLRLRHSAVSQFNPSKRVCLLRWRQQSGGSNDVDDRLQRVLGSLEALVSDVGELVTFLTGCPRLNRQPYSTYLFLDTCMFGRQMEMDRVVSFLLQDEGGRRPQQRRPDVLTILGPRRAGKSTLVEHACRDERVRNRFSQIVSLTRGDLLLASGGGGGDGEDMPLPLQQALLPAPTSNGGSGGAVEHHRQQGGGGSSINQEEIISSVLVIVELDGERNSKGEDAMAVTESLLARFCSSTCCKNRRTPFVVTKIIVTSRSEKMSSFGTVEPLRLRPLTQEALWYLVKARAFGSTDAAEHPEMVAIDMDMAAEMHGSFAFAAADVFGGLLRSSFSARFWSLALAVLREFKKKNLLRLHQSTDGEERAEKFVHLDEYQIKPSSSCSSTQQQQHGETPIIPMLSLRDILFGGARPQGKFDVVGWKSMVPPYYTYAYRCEILRAPLRGS